ncbi:C4-dicarboxylate ABC transporter, partial [Vibrio sp. M260118]
DTQQAAVETTCMATMTYSIAEGEALQFAAMEKAKENGVEIRYWNDEMLNLFENTWLEVVEEKKAADPFFDKVWADLSTFREGYALWAVNGFLPRETQNK